MRETISPKETIKHTENSENICAWKTNLRRNRKEVETEQALGATTDRFGRGAASFVASGRRGCRDGHDLLWESVWRDGFSMPTSSQKPSVEVSAVRNDC